jgi:hypothetical protein
MTFDQALHRSCTQPRVPDPQTPNARNLSEGRCIRVVSEIILSTAIYAENGPLLEQVIQQVKGILFDTNGKLHRLILAVLLYYVTQEMELLTDLGGWWPIPFEALKANMP